MTPEFAILLTTPFDAGVNGKCWRLLKSWYDHPTCCAKFVKMSGWSGLCSKKIILAGHSLEAQDEAKYLAE